MALSPSSAPTSPLPRQLLRYVSSQLVAALNRPTPAISLPSASRGVDAAASQSQRLRAASRAAHPSPKAGRPGAPRQGSGGHVHAAPATATTAPRVVMRELAPPGLAVQGISGKTHAATTASVVMGGPAPSVLPDAQGSRGGKVDAAASLATVRRPTPPGPPRQGSGGGGGIIH